MIVFIALAMDTITVERLTPCVRSMSCILLSAKCFSNIDKRDRESTADTDPRQHERLAHLSFVAMWGKILSWILLNNATLTRWCLWNSNGPRFRTRAVHDTLRRFAWYGNSVSGVLFLLLHRDSWWTPIICNKNAIINTCFIMANSMACDKIIRREKKFHPLKIHLREGVLLVFS